MPLQKRLGPLAPPHPMYESIGAAASGTLQGGPKKKN